MVEDVQPDIPLQPVPVGLRWDLQVFANQDGDRQPFIALRVQSPLGSQTYFLPPLNAKELSAGLAAVADTAAELEHQGLIIPTVTPMDDPRFNGGGGA